MKPEISYEDFEKLDLRVAEILEATPVEGTDKLVKLKISLGEGEDGEETRTLVAGIKQHYSPDVLLGKKIIIIANLAPRTLKGIESKGMLLAASSDDKKELSLLSVDDDIPVGSRVG